MATVTVNTLEFVSALRALIPVSKQATLYSGEKERNAATIAARITPAKKLALITMSNTKNNQNLPEIQRKIRGFSNEADEVIGFISAIAHSDLTENQKERLIVELLKQLDETLLKFREYVVGAQESIEQK